jgi:hypothetical protein
MADIGLFVSSYESCKSTFRATSLDDSNEVSLCKDESCEVIDFDKIIQKIYPNSNTRPKSFDAIYIYENNIYCIEFKNQKSNMINKNEISGKLKDGIGELDKMLANLKIQKKRYNFIFCVVYKKCKEPIDRYKCGISKNKILFGLEKYKNQHNIKDIFTQNVEFFTNQFKKITMKELKC